MQLFKLLFLFLGIGKLLFVGFFAIFGNLVSALDKLEIIIIMQLTALFKSIHNAFKLIVIP